MKCKNCGHEIFKRYNRSKLMDEWKHKKGGTYCKVNSILGGCLCHNAEPLEEAEGKGGD